MADLAGLRRKPAEDVYRRYQEWLAFTVRTEAFLEAIDADLGIGPSQVDDHPARAALLGQAA